jgi:hypothetical protein
MSCYTVTIGLPDKGLHNLSLQAGKVLVSINFTHAKQSKAKQSKAKQSKANIIVYATVI